MTILVDKKMLILGVVFSLVFTSLIAPLSTKADWRCTRDQNVSAPTQGACEGLCGGINTCGAYRCNGRYYSTVENCVAAGCPCDTDWRLFTADFPETATLDPEIVAPPTPPGRTPPSPPPSRTNPTNPIDPNAPRSRFEGYYPQAAPPGPGAGPIDSVGGVLGTLLSVVSLAEIVFWICAVGFGLYGAYLYLFSVGNKESAATARRVFLYAVIASLLAIVAYGIPGIVEGFIFGF